LKYFFHLCNDEETVLDVEGRKFENLDEVRRAALEAARDIICSEVRDGHLKLNQRIDVVDERNFVAYSLKFADAVRITGLAG
jgi:hypothetical protein